MIGADIVEHEVGGVRYDRKTRMIEPDSVNGEEPDIIRHHDQPTIVTQRRQSRTYGRRMSCQSGMCSDDSIHIHLPELPMIKEEESEKASLRSLFKNIAIRRRKRKKRILFNTNDHNKATVKKRQESNISVVQQTSLLPVLPFCKAMEETESKKASTYV
jgi:hypothetical protein